jgi:hypothetical protein
MDFLCPDRRWRKAFPLLASHCVDHKQALQDTCTKKHTCPGCGACEGEFDRLTTSSCPFPRKDAQSMKKLYEEIKARDKCVDDHDNITDHTKFEQAEASFSGCRFTSHVYLLVYNPFNMASTCPSDPVPASTFYCHAAVPWS